MNKLSQVGAAIAVLSLPFGLTMHSANSIDPTHVTMPSGAYLVNATPSSISSASAANNDTVTLHNGGINTKVKTHAATVSDFLKEQKLQITDSDVVAPSRNSSMTGVTDVWIDTMQVAVQTVTTVLPFPTTTSSTPVPCTNITDTQKVLQKGSDGKKVDVWNLVTLDSKTYRNLAKSTTSNPTPQVVAQCIVNSTSAPTTTTVTTPTTTTVTVPTTVTKPGGSTTTTTTTVTNQSGGTTTDTNPTTTVVTTSIPSTKTGLMAAAGISPSDYGYVDYIVTHESSWNPLAINPSSGAGGLCQALPFTKMATAGSDYRTNPLTQMKWCNSYARATYGGDNGWRNAYNFWVAHHWW